MHKALTVIGLPVFNEDGVATGETIRKEPGSKITKEEFNKAGMTQEQISEMEDAGSISTDMDAELHPDHIPVPANMPSVAALVQQARVLMDQLGDDVPAEVKKLAALDHEERGSSEAATGGDRSGR